MKTIVRLSPTVLSAWYSLGCPAAWSFSRRYDRRIPMPSFQLGTLVHAMMEGTLDPDLPDEVWFKIGAQGPYEWATPTMLRTAAVVFHKLIAMKSFLGITVMRDKNDQPLVEQKLTWRALPNIDFVVKIDFLGFNEDGDPIVVDWKSSMGTGWKPLPENLFYPQANGFQSIGYLIPPPTRIRRKIGLPIPGWPKKLYYIVGPTRGGAQVYTYEWNDRDYANFKKAIKLAAETIRQGIFPRVYGYHCHDCAWKGPCFRYDGWQDDYRPREE